MDAPNEKELRRFWSKVAITSNSDECWEWQRGIKNGYGIFGFKYRTWYAHRFSYELAYGAIPQGLFVCHSCDNKKCVNPKHFFLGTDQDNKDDMVRKGRHAHGSRLSPLRRGEKHPSHILTEDRVRYIRERYAVGDITQTALAIEVGMSLSTVNHIVRGRKWKHVA